MDENPDSEQVERHAGQADGQGSPDREGSRFGRRGILLGGVGAAIGGLAAAAPAEAASGEPVILGQPNVASSPTSLLDNGPTGPALYAEHHPGMKATEPVPLEAGVAGFGARFGMLGSTLAPSEVGISALAPDFRAGVAGFGARFGMLGSTLAPSEVGISALAPDFAAGVVGFGARFGMLGSTLAPSEVGFSALAPDFGAGLAGFGPTFGVWGRGGGDAEPPPPVAAAGIVGTASGPEGTGVVARNPAGWAIQAVGRLAFSTAGRGTVPAGQRFAIVEHPSIGFDSLVNVTLLGDGGGKVWLHHVEAEPGLLRVVLKGLPGRDVPFAYLIFEPIT